MNIFIHFANRPVRRFCRHGKLITLYTFSSHFFSYTLCNRARLIPRFYLQAALILCCIYSTMSRKHSSEILLGVGMTWSYIAGDLSTGSQRCSVGLIWWLWRPFEYTELIIRVDKVFLKFFGAILISSCELYLQSPVLSWQNWHPVWSSAALPHV